MKKTCMYLQDKRFCMRVFGLLCHQQCVHEERCFTALLLFSDHRGARGGGVGVQAESRLPHASHNPSVCLLRPQEEQKLPGAQGPSTSTSLFYFLFLFFSMYCWSFTPFLCRFCFSPFPFSLPHNVDLFTSCLSPSLIFIRLHTFLPPCFSRFLSHRLLLFFR